VRSSESCIVLFLFVLLLSSCTSPAPEATVTPTVAPVTDSVLAASPTSTPEPSSTPVPVIPRAQYTLDALMDYTRKRLEVTEKIIYPNHTGETLTSLVLAVQPNLWPQVFFLDSLAVDGQAVDNYTLNGQQLEVPLAAPIEPLGTATVEIGFRLFLPYFEIQENYYPIREQLFGYNYRQSNLLDWYPFIVPYRAGEGWLLRKPFDFGEHLVYEAADFDVTLRFTDAPIPVVAASGRGEPIDLGFHYTLEKARDFVLSVSADFLLEQRDVDGVIVSSYFFPFTEKDGVAAADLAVQALRIFGDKFGAYPHPSLSVVMNPGEYAMEYDGLILMNRHLYWDMGKLEMFTAHEVAHQWWFGLVGSDQAMEPWLDEGLATYSERIYYEALEPPRGTWWVSARLFGYEPQYWLDTSIHDYYGRLYTEAVYLDGAAFLQEIRERIGDEAFFAFLQGYAETYAHRIATTQDFFDLLRRHTTVDFSDIVDKYFHGSYE